MSPAEEGPPIHLSREVYQAIIDHAREGTPEEVCGILRGRGQRAFALVRGRNVAAEPIDNYTVDPQTLLRQFEFEDAGDEMMAIYHSHPVSEAYPSATDAWNAHYPDSYYIICSLETASAPDVRAFRLLPHFPALDSDVLRRALAFTEVRPGLFGYYQPREQGLPSPLAALAGEIPPPFYVVFAEDDGGQVDEIRVVQVREHPIPRPE